MSAKHVPRLSVTDDGAGYHSNHEEGPLRELFTQLPDVSTGVIISGLSNIHRNGMVK